MSSRVSIERLPRFRWVVCALLLFATTSNYMDRQVLGILAPHLEREFGWSEIEYATIVTAFQAAYAIGLVLSGFCIDKLGARWSLILAVTLWSIASIAHGWARSAAHFAAARFALGIFEAGNFPASIKASAEWFPPRERGLAIGLFNSGANLGAIVAPLLVPYVALQYGWPNAFFLLGALGLLWVGAALLYLRSPTSSQRAVIHGNSQTPAMHASWRAVLGHRETWLFAFAKFLTDPVWWFYLYWTPKYLSSTYGVELSQVGVPLLAIYLCADVGSVMGGWWSGALIRRGYAVRRARMYVMLRCALAALLVISVVYVTDLWLAVLLVGLATAAHQAWSANLFASVADAIPERYVATVIGIGGTSGALGGMLVAQGVGRVLESTGSYTSVFIACSSMYLLVWLAHSFCEARFTRCEK